MCMSEHAEYLGKRGFHMISLLIKFLTLVLIVIALSTFRRKKDVIKILFKAVNAGYAYILNSMGTYIKKLMKLAVFLIIVQFFLIAFQKCCFEEGRGITGKSLLMTIVIWILISVSMYFFIGSILALYVKTVGIIGNIKNSNISAKMLISFLLLTLFVFFSVVSENELKQNLFFLLFGTIICYILNVQILLKVVQNPFCLVGDKNQHRSEDKVLIIFTASLILLMFVVNMYLLVLWIYYSYDGAYCCSIGDGVITKWMLLYYTMISFTTIGYGDISPAIFESQIVAIIIAITSVLCLIVFVSSVLSEKNEILNDNAYVGQESWGEDEDKSKE